MMHCNGQHDLNIKTCKACVTGAGVAQCTTNGSSQDVLCIQPTLCACVLLLLPMLISFVQPVQGLHDYACMPYCCNFSQVIACVGSSLIL